MEDPQEEDDCPICGLKFARDKLEAHVNKCLFLKEAGPSDSPSTKRNFSIFSSAATGQGHSHKRLKKDTSHVEPDIVIDSDSDNEVQLDRSSNKPIHQSVMKLPLKMAKEPPKAMIDHNSTPLAERMRPETLEHYIGQTHVMNKNAVLRTVLEKHEIPSMIFWGPPGCGKVG